jgi:glycosyltransferase involved in cell wall biosynthesis
MAQLLRNGTPDLTQRETTPLRVLIASPLGAGGKGGIDRVMDNLANAVRAGDGSISVKVVATRGGGHAIAMAPTLAVFMVKLLKGRMSRAIDIVHINVAQRGSIRRKDLIARLCRRVGIPYVVHVHGSRFHDSWHNDGPAMQARMRKLVTGAARVIVLGTFWRDFVTSIGGEAERVVVVANATHHPDQANEHLNTRPARILFLGQMGARKGVPQLIEALGDLPKDRDWTATLAGDGDVLKVRKEVAAVGLEPRVKVLGWAGPQEVAELLRNHDILVLPSFNENLPMSVIEGMAHGMAIVTTPVGAVEDIIEQDVSGLLVPPGDVAALTLALTKCVEDSDLRTSLGAKARAFHADHLDLASYADRVVAVWRSALADIGR